MVSPYLLRPVRNLKEVLNAAGALVSERETALLPFSPRGVSGTAAAILRRQGRILRPRIVWVNEPERPIGKPRKKD